jgi:hypothetical protein
VKVMVTMGTDAQKQFSSAAQELTPQEYEQMVGALKDLLNEDLSSGYFALDLDEKGSVALLPINKVDFVHVEVLEES